MFIKTIFAIFGLLAVIVQSRPQHQQNKPILQKINDNYHLTERELEQNREAKYEFSTDIDDGINDQTQSRIETRNGLKVTGMYSYSDGYYKRTIHYEADENGYRVISEEIEPLKEGPKVDLTGTASVNTAAHGTHLAYRVQSVPIPGPVAKIVTNDQN